MNEKVSAIIVTFNPNIIVLKKLIKKLIPQVFEIVICDNSDNLLNFDLINEKIFIKKMSNNIGIAAAQNIGMDFAFKHGADFIIQFDQDSLPSENLVEILVKTYHNLKSKGINIGLVLSNNGSVKINKSYECILNGISSGTLVHREIYKKLGKLEDKLFIDLVDYEYCWRCLMHKKKVIIVRDAIIKHKLGESTINFLFKKINKSIPIRNYYYFRNSLILLYRNYVPVSWKIKNIIHLFILFLVTLLIFDNKTLRIKFMIKGIIDGLKNKLGPINNEL